MAIYLGSERVGFQTSQIENIPTDAMKSIMDQTIESYYNNRISKIGSFIFYRCSNLSSVSFPNCTTIGSNAFYQCSNLTLISCPSCS